MMFVDYKAYLIGHFGQCEHVLIPITEGTAYSSFTTL